MANILPVDVGTLTTTELFALYRRTLAALKDRGIIRTLNAPAGDYAEYLVAAALGGELAANSERSWDVRLPDGTRLQVKSRVVSDPPARSQLQLSPIRSYGFDAAVIVLLSDEDYSIRRAVRLPREVVEEVGRYSKHVNGYIVIATVALLNHSAAVDLTDLLRARQA